MDRMAWLSETVCMCNYCLVPSSMFEVLIVYDSRMENTKLTAKAISKGEREAGLDAEVKRE